MSVSHTSLPCWRSISSLLLCWIALFGIGFVDGALQVEDGLFLVLSEEGQGCSAACANENLMCSYASLAAGASYVTADVIAGYVEDAGGSCEVVVGDRSGTRNPRIIKGRCFGKQSGRTNFNCALDAGGSGGVRLCSCFGDGDPTPTTLAPTPAPTQDDNIFTTSPPTVAPVESPTTILPPEDYKLIWRDDFDGDDINTTNWSRGLVYDKNPSQHVLWNPKSGGPNLLNFRYDGYILDENTYTTGTGFLELRNKEENPPIQGTSPVGTYHYSSGWCNSLHKVFFNGSKEGKGNYLEVRAKFPTGNVGKVWAAIWMVPESEDWPPEIDIWEYFGLFFNSAWGFDQMQFRVRYGWPGNTTAAKRRLGDFQTRWAQDYHIYGWTWTRNIMIWYIDGVQVGTIERGVDVFPWRWPDEDMAFILQQATMESIEPDDPAMTTDFPNVLSIDYMALYEKI